MGLTSIAPAMRTDPLRIGVTSSSLTNGAVSMKERTVERTSWDNGKKQVKVQALNDKLHV